jgi:hypothetical protein
VRLVIARCQVDYAGRLTAHLPMATRLLLVKSDGSVSVHSDDRAYKPLNWMSPPCWLIEDGKLWIVENKQGEKLVISIEEIYHDHAQELGAEPGLQKDGVEAHLQELLAEQPECCGEGFRLVRREWPTDIGPVDLMCRDAEEGWIAVEIKRVAGIEAVEQLSRYLERIRLDPAMSSCRGVLAAQGIKPQARVLAAAREIDCVEVDLAVLRGERQPDLKLFAA